MIDYRIHVTAIEVYEGGVLPKIKSINEFAMPWVVGAGLKYYRELIANHLNTKPELIKLSSFDYMLEDILDEYVIKLPQLPENVNVA